MQIGQRKSCILLVSNKDLHISKHLQDIINENLNFREQYRYSEEFAKLKRNKMNHYGMIVKDKYVPKIDIHKRNDIEFRKSTIENGRTAGNKNFRTEDIEK